MENQYTYYTPGSDPQNTNSQNYSGGEKPDNHEKKNRGRKVKKVVGGLCFAAAFGVVAGSAFQAVNLVGNKIFGTEQTKSAPADKKVSSTTLTRTSNTVTSDVAGVVENVMPSVVSITNMSIQQVQSFFGGTSSQQVQSSGSGIIIGQNESELLILTNNHVVEGSTTLTTSFIDEESAEAKIKGTDPANDLAVISVPLDNVKAETMSAIKVATLGDSKKLQVGEPAIAIGNALGYGQSVTTGIISALDRKIQMDGFDASLIQTDAAINPGNSGGALVNANGEVVGINTVKVNNSAVEGMGYAIPISDASDTITALMNKETRNLVAEAERGFLGIEGTNVEADSSQLFGIPQGVYIREVIKKTGADEAGLIRGMVITKLDGTTVDGMQTLQSELSYYKKGETVTLTVEMPDENGGYKEKNIDVTLGERQK